MYKLIKKNSFSFVSDGSIGLSAHLGLLIFTSYIMTYVLSFQYVILWFLYFIINMVSEP